ncbi:MAG: MoaD/ThiS family protein [Bacillota bacterium]
MEAKSTHMLRVRLRLKGGLEAYAPGKASTHVVEVAPGSNVADALRLLGIPVHEVMGAISGGVLKHLDQPLNEGEELEVLPVVAGG